MARTMKPEDREAFYAALEAVSGDMDGTDELSRRRSARAEADQNTLLGGFTGPVT